MYDARRSTKYKMVGEHMHYFTLLTQIGLQKLATATAQNKTLNLTHMVVGDGNGQEIIPTDSMTSLVNKMFQLPISELKINDNNNNWIEASGYIPAQNGDFWVREVGLVDEDGDLIALGNYPQTFKPTVENGVANDMHIKMILEVSNTSNISFVVDPTFEMANKEYVEKSIANIKPTLETMTSNVMIHCDDIGLKNTDGDSYFEKSTSETKLHIQNGVFTYTNGLSESGFIRKSDVFTGEVDFTNVSDGEKWIAKELNGGFKFYDKKPMLSNDSIEANENRVLFDVNKGKFFKALSENIVPNGNFEHGIEGWESGINSPSLSYNVESKQLKVQNNGNTFGEASIKLTDLDTSQTYMVKGNVYGLGLFRIYDENYPSNTNAYASSSWTNGGEEVCFEFKPKSEVAYLVVTNNADVAEHYYSNIQCFKKNYSYRKYVKSLSFLKQPVRVIKGVPKLINEKQQLNVNVMDSLEIQYGFNLHQSWQNMMSQRKADSIYVNTTGKPISIKVACRVKTQGHIQLRAEVNGEPIVRQELYNNTIAHYTIQESLIIPVGSQYKVFTNGYGEIITWYELR